MPARTVPAKRLDGKRLAQEDAYRQDAKAAFEAHNRTTAGKDVLERCKRLNEFLESDFLKPGKGGKQSKEQLKEILGILNEGPKRPSFLDKPPVTSTSAQKTKSTSVQPLSNLDADKLLGLIECDQEPRSRAMVAASPSASTSASQEDVDDLIGLLNDASSSKPRSAALQEQAERDAAAARAAEEAEKARKEAEARQQAMQQARRLREQEAEERKRKEEEQKKQKQDEDRKKAEEEKKREEEARRRRQEAEAAERTRLRNRSAVSIQRVVRGFLVRRRVAAQREQLLAALTLQAAVRALTCRRLLHELKLETFRRKRAARCIAAYYLAYKSQWHLGPLRVHTSAGAAALDGHAHLLAMPIRLRSTADTRLAPEAPQVSPYDATIDADGAAVVSASGKRIAASARRRVGEMAKQDSMKRDDVGARAIMAGSEHRGFQAAMQLVKSGGTGIKAAGLPSKPSNVPSEFKAVAKPAAAAGKGSVGKEAGSGPKAALPVGPRRAASYEGDAGKPSMLAAKPRPASEDGVPQAVPLSASRSRPSSQGSELGSAGSRPTSRESGPKAPLPAGPKKPSSQVAESKPAAKAGSVSRTSSKESVDKAAVLPAVLSRPGSRD